MIQGVIFDIDGVLLDSLKIWKDLGKRYIVSLGKTPVSNMNEILYPMSLEEGASFLKNAFHLEKTEQDIIFELGKMIETFYFDEVKAKDGAKEVLEVCMENGISVVCATSSVKSLAEKALERNGLLKYIRHIFTTSEIGKSKSDVLIYDRACLYLGCEKENTLVVEDSLYALLTAKNAGYLIAGVFDENGEKEQKSLKNVSDIYCLNLWELENYIRENS